MRRFALGIALLAAAGSARGQMSHAVAGTVLTIDGKPVPNAIVTLVAGSAGIPSGRHLSAKSQTDGAFTIANVPKGDYRACVRSEASAVLDPCIWGGFPIEISVSGDAAPPPARVVVNRGIELAVRIDDPEGRLAAFNEKASRRPALSAGVFTPRRMYLPMSLASAGATLRQYRVVVPVGVALRLVLASTDFEFDPGAGPAPGLFRQDGINLIGSLTLPKGASKTELKLRLKSRKQS